MASKTCENTHANTIDGVYRSYSTTWGRYTNQYIEFTTTVGNFLRWWSCERLIAGMAEALAEKTCGGNSKEASRSSSSGTLTWYTPRINTFKKNTPGKWWKVMRTTAIRLASSCFKNKVIRVQSFESHAAMSTSLWLPWHKPIAGIQSRMTRTRRLLNLTRGNAFLHIWYLCVKHQWSYDSKWLR